MLSFSKTVNKLKYIIKHWIAFQQTAMELNIWSFRFLFHDIDKIILLFILWNPKLVSKIHRTYSLHHIENIFYKKFGLNFIDVKQMFVDWECSRYTKPDKPYTALEVLTWFPEVKEELEPLFNQYLKGKKQ